MARMYSSAAATSRWSWIAAKTAAATRAEEYRPPRKHSASMALRHGSGALDRSTPAAMIWHSVILRGFVLQELVCVAPQFWPTRNARWGRSEDACARALAPAVARPPELSLGRMLSEGATFHRGNAAPRSYRRRLT
jgi:hypothetical protein